MKCITRITVKDASTMTEGVPLLSFDEHSNSRSELRSRVSNIRACPKKITKTCKNPQTLFDLMHF